MYAHDPSFSCDEMEDEIENEIKNVDYFGSIRRGFSIESLKYQHEVAFMFDGMLKTP